MKARRNLVIIIIALVLAGLAAAAVFLYLRPGEPPDKQLMRAMYRNWVADHDEIVKEQGTPSEFKFVTIHFQIFSTGAMTYNVTDREAIAYFGQSGTFRRLPTPDSHLTPGPHPKYNEELLKTLLDGVPPEDRDKYESLFFERMLYDRLGIVGGIGTLYMREKLLHDFGSPLSNEKRFDNVLYAKGKNYDLLVGLPIGGEGPFTPGDRQPPRRVFALYKADNRYEYYTEFPANYNDSFALTLPRAISEFYQTHHQSAWFLPLTALGGFLITYLFGMMALLLLAWQRGSIIFSRTLLISISAKPLLVVPGLGRRILFLGYRKRITKLKDISRVAEKYFGLPAEDSDGLIPFDPTGETLHQRIAEALAPQQPILLVGKGGAGKSTILARLSYLAIEKRLPESLEGFVPLFIPASYYSGSLIQAIADTLRARDGVAVDEEIIKGQLQTGKFLILFDGVSEVITPIQQSLEEILKTAKHADYRSCRFIISTRPLDTSPSNISTLHLHPLTLDVIPSILEHSELHSARKNHVLRQLRYFGQKPIAPLLFSMIMEEDEEQQVSSTQSQIYERYFRELLRVKKDDNLWAGWQKALEIIALHTFIETGRRGVGLPHEQLMNLLDEKKGDGGGQSAESLSNLLNRLYHLSVKDELHLLNQLLAAGLLHRGRRWRFAHETFEEFFAASYIVSYFDLHEKLPSLDKWMQSKEQKQAFSDVLEFVREMMDDASQLQLLKMDLPHAWKTRLTETSNDEIQP
ncbi:MAG: NB-ARC domain-containing protein [Acidobacteriota bacterium]|nr:NB-ARC domain-containing protein [Acidobacteriota bacterium]